MRASKKVAFKVVTKSYAASKQDITKYTNNIGKHLIYII